MNPPPSKGRNPPWGEVCLQFLFSVTLLCQARCGLLLLPGPLLRAMSLYQLSMELGEDLTHNASRWRHWNKSCRVSAFKPPRPITSLGACPANPRPEEGHRGMGCYSPPSPPLFFGGLLI
ncbi:hypothetical protein LIER_35012 [Lithospermum erythrorhizon]|uniref:Uncharacterized protein n=1 Tax=Lithospermum erythrorhizon TaxID=34254 RepID=A0AAV3NI32_LITER